MISRHLLTFLCPTILFIAISISYNVLPASAQPCLTCESIPGEQPACASQNPGNTCGVNAVCGRDLCDSSYCVQMCTSCSCGYGQKCVRSRPFRQYSGRYLRINNTLSIQLRFTATRTCVTNHHGIDLEQP